MNQQPWGRYESSRTDEPQTPVKSFWNSFSSVLGIGVALLLFGPVLLWQFSHSPETHVIKSAYKWATNKGDHKCDDVGDFLDGYAPYYASIFTLDRITSPSDFTGRVAEAEGYLLRTTVPKAANDFYEANLRMTAYLQDGFIRDAQMSFGSEEALAEKSLPYFKPVAEAENDLKKKCGKEVQRYIDTYNATIP